MATTGARRGSRWASLLCVEGEPAEGEQKATVRHGLGYSIFESEYRGIRSEATFLIPKDQAFEYWSVKVTNTTDKPRTISTFSYAELANEWNYRQDLENLQYSQYVVVAKYADGMISRKNSTRDAFKSLWFGVAGADVASYDTDRDAFLGAYRTQSAPLAVENGECTGSECIGDNSTASLHTRLELAPGETRQVIYMLGIGDPDAPWDDEDTMNPVTHRPGREIMAEYGTPERVDAELEAIRAEWRDFLAPLQVKTPDAQMNSMINVWHAYQTHMTFNWSRGVSLIEAGDRDGLGYRDTVQDMLSVIHAIPGPVRERLDMILTGQTEEGGAMPLVKPLTHNPGHEETPTLEKYRSDDPLWLPITVANFVYETGDLGYLDTVLPYADHGQATVFEHLVQAIKFSLAHQGQNQPGAGPAGGLERLPAVRDHGREHVLDVPDGERRARDRGARGAVGAGCRRGVGARRAGGDCSRCSRARGTARGTSAASPPRAPSLGPMRLTRARSTWSRTCGPRSRRRCRASGRCRRWTRCRSGCRRSTAWRCARRPTPSRCRAWGCRLLVFPVGHKENGGIFCHANSWTLVAEGVLGRGQRAYDYYRAYLPARYNDSAEVHQVEPYVYCQFTHGPESPRFGQARNPWLTGTASWSYVGVTQYILGIRPELEGLRIDPCVPASWGDYEVTRTFRGKTVTVRVTNPRWCGNRRFVGGRQWRAA